MSEAASVLKNTRVIAVLTFASRLLGLAREIVFGYFFGTGAVLSAFRLAFVIPNLSRRLFGEGALSSSLIPILSESVVRDGDERARRLAGAVLGWLAVFLGGFIIVAELVLAVVRAMRPELALDLIAILMPYMLLICVAAVAGGVLNIRSHFVVPAAAPLVLNLAIIIAAALGAWAGRDEVSLMRWVCMAVIISGALQMVAQLAALKRLRFRPIFSLSREDPNLRRVLSMMGPMVFGLSAVQFSVLTDYLIAYVVVRDPAGEPVGPAILGYAQYLYQLPLGVIGISLATAVFPVMSGCAARRDHEGLSHVVIKGLRTTLFIGLPASVGLIFVARPLVAVLFERGDFDAADTRRVAAALVCYAVGMGAYFANHVLIRTFYALKDTRTPVRIAAWMVGLNIVIGATLVFTPLQERGLALATSITAIGQTVALTAVLRRRLPGLGGAELTAALGRTLIATAVMGMSLAALTLPDFAARWLGHRAAVELAALLAAGVGVYALSARLLHMSELNECLGLPLRR